MSQYQVQPQAIKHNNMQPSFNFLCIVLHDNLQWKCNVNHVSKSMSRVIDTISKLKQHSLTF